MKILFVTPSLPYPPDKDGQAVIAYHVLRELSGRHELQVFCFHDREDRERQSVLTERGMNVRFFPKPKPSMASFYLFRRWQRAWFQDKWFSPELQTAITEADQDRRYELIVIHSPFLSAYVDAVQHTPVIFQSIDALSSWFNQIAGRPDNWLKRLHYRFEAAKAARLEAALPAKVRQVIVVSDEDAEIFRRASGQRNISAIPNGVDIEYFHPTGDPPEDNILVFTGVMNYPPNVEAVREFHHQVWTKLRAERPNLRWLIVGKNPTPPIVALQGQDPRITVTGYVADVRPWLQRATIYIAPVTIGTGFKNKIIEAMAMRKAVIATPESLAGFRVTDGQQVVIAPTIKDFYDKILFLLERPAYRHQLGDRARQTAEQSSWKAVAAAYENVYAGL